MKRRNGSTAARYLLMGAMAVTIGAASHYARAGSSYDSPSMGRDGGCIGLTGYTATRSKPPRDGDRYRVDIDVKNVCGRTLDVRLCLQYVQPVDGEGAKCFDLTLRPSSGTRKRNLALPARPAGPTYEWRLVEYDKYD